MNTATKAALLSILVFGGVIAGYFLVFHDKGGGPGDVAETGSPPPVKAGAEPKSAPSVSEAESVAELAPIERGSVPLRVEVHEKGTERLLARATVSVYRESDGGQTGKKVSTPPARGGVLECKLEPGAFEVWAQCTGFSGAKKKITLVKGQTPQPLILDLDRGSSISGRVLTRAGQPIAGADVFALKDFTEPEADLEAILREFTKLEQMVEQKYTAAARTADDGGFQLDGLENYWYTVRAVAGGYTPGEKAGVRSPSANLDLVLDQGGVLRGVVRSTDGRAIPGARVRAWPEPENAGLFDVILSKARPPVEEAETDASGRYQLSSLGAGVYNFLADAPTYQEAKELKVRIHAGENPERDFTLQPGNILQGFVKGPSDEAVVGARIRATPVGLAVKPGEEVRIRFDDGSVLSDEQGYFLFNNLPQTKHMLLVSHDDYQSQQRKDVLPSEGEVIIRMVAGSRMRGSIVDAASKQPIPGASVSVADLANIRKEGVSDDQGQYVVGGLGSTRKPVQVFVKAEGFGRAKRQVTLKEGQEVEEDFELEPTGIVLGRVVGADRTPLMGADVEIRRAQESSGTDQVIGHGTSDREGKFEIENVEPGPNARVRVKLAAFLETFSEPFPLEPGQSAQVPDLVLQLGGSVEGRVVAATGEGLAGCWITALRDGSTDINRLSAGNATTNADGYFALRGLAGGKYELEVKAAGLLDKKQAGVEIREGLANTGLQIVMEPGGTVGGLVLDAQRQPVSGAEVTIKDFSEGLQEHRAVSDAEGRFRLSTVVSHDVVEVSVHHDDFGAYSNPKVPVGTENLEVLLKQLGVIRGVVIDPQSQPVSSFTVQAEAAESSDKTKRLGPKTYNPTDGGFEYRGVTDGVFTVSVRAPNFSATSIPNVAVRSGDEVDLGVIQLQEGGRISGEVRAAGTGAPVARASVRITQGFRAFRDSGAKVADDTGPDGSFAFDGLKDGVVTLEVSHADFVRKRVTGVDPKIAERSRNLVIELERGGEITGSVLGRGQKPLKGINIYLVGKGEDGEAGNQTTTSDGAGAFRFLGVHPGLYRVRAHKFGNPPISSEVEVQMAAGGSQQVALELDLE